MKKLIFLSFMLLNCTYLSSFAQKYGITAGLNISNMAVKEDNRPGDPAIETSTKTGFHFGPIVKFKINNTLSFKTGIIYSSQGYKYMSLDGPIDIVKGETTLNYLQLPLTITLAYLLSDIQIYGIIGSYVGYGLSGKDKYNRNGDIFYENKIEWGREADYSRADYGLDFGVGIEYKSVQIEFRYKLGLKDLQYPANDGWSSKNRVVGISLAYFLNNK